MRQKQAGPVQPYVHFVPTHFEEFVVVFLSQQGEEDKRNVIFSPTHNQRNKSAAQKSLSCVLSGINQHLIMTEF